MRSGDIRLRPCTTNADNGYSFLIAVAVSHRDGSIKSKFDLEANWILATDPGKVERDSLPSKNYAIPILDHVDVVPGTPISSKIVPQAGDHGPSIQISFRTERIIARRKTKIQGAIGR